MHCPERQETGKQRQELGRLQKKAGSASTRQRAKANDLKQQPLTLKIHTFLLCKIIIYLPHTELVTYWLNYTFLCARIYTI